VPPTATRKKDNALWFTGVCDDLHRKILIWNQAYWYGEVHSTRQWLDPSSGKPEDKPVKMAHKIPFREVELEHLVRIIESLRPNSALATELKEIKSVWKYAKAVRGFRFLHSYWSKVPLPSGLHRSVTLIFYPEHVKEIISILQEAKTGQKAETKSSDKDMFEE